MLIGFSFFIFWRMHLIWNCGIVMFQLKIVNINFNFKLNVKTLVYCPSYYLLRSSEVHITLSSVLIWCTVTTQ